MKDSGASGTKQLPPAPADVVDLIRSIGQAMTNSNLYSIRHPVTVSAIEQAYERFVPLMEQCGSITFALFEDHLTVNGELVDTNNHLAAKFAERMRSLGIEGFTAEKETTPDEFVRLILFFASNAMADGSKGTAALSTECGFNHVKSKTVRYEQVLDGQAVVDDKTASQVQSLRGFVVENIMAFLKGDVDSEGKAALGNLENVENNAQALGEMILKAAVVRQQSPDLSQGETLGRLVVGCLRRTFSSLSDDPAARTQKGEKALRRSLIMLEKDVLDKLRAMGGEEAEQAAADVQEAVREIQDETMMDALAEQYAKRVEALSGNEKRILRYIKRVGVEAATESGLKNRLMENGLSDEGWNKLVIRSGASPASDGKGTGLDGLAGGGNSGLMLAALLKQFTELASVPSGSSPAQATQVAAELNNGVNKLVEQAAGKIDNLAKEIRKRKNASSKSGAMGEADAVAWIVAAVAEICQELRQPLAVINGTMDILIDGRAGPLEPLQNETVRLASDCGQRLSLLITKLESIAGGSEEPALY
jgi:hypothetical protein